jgi:hypothetical protein
VTPETAAAMAEDRARRILTGGRPVDGQNAALLGLLCGWAKGSDREAAAVLRAVAALVEDRDRRILGETS